MEAVAEQASGMRRCRVIMRRQWPGILLRNSDMAEIAALRPVAAECPAFHLRFRRRRLDRPLAAAWHRKPVRPDLSTEKIVGSEFPRRQAVAEAGGERIGRIMVLVLALECRDPKRLGAAFRQRSIKLG